MFQCVVFVLFVQILPSVLAVQVYESVELFEYNDFSSTWPFVYTVPDSVSMATWVFQAGNMEEGYCDDKNITVYLQYGSLPVVNPDGEKFPDSFYLPRKSSGQTWLISNNKSISTSISDPQAGNWYVVVSLPKHDDRIRPQDLFVRCKYNFRSTFTMATSTNIAPISVNKPEQLSLTGHEQIAYRFDVGLQTYRYTILVTNCSRPDTNDTDCPVSIATKRTAISNLTNTSIVPFLQDEQTPLSIDCLKLEGQPCLLKVESPAVMTSNDVYVMSQVDSQLEFDLKIEKQDCSMDTKLEPNSVQYGSATDCHLMSVLDRVSSNSMYKTKFISYINKTVHKVKSMTSATTTQLVPFQIKPEQDTGGSLVVSMELMDITILGDRSTIVEVIVCIRRSTIVSYNDSVVCEDGSQLSVSDSVQSADIVEVKKVIIPYPQPGVWFAALTMKCRVPTTANDSVDAMETDIPCGNMSSRVALTIETNKCVEGGCSGHGDCHNYLNGQVLFSTCKCYAGWRGFACTDGSESRPKTDQLLEVLLLTISNIIFLPAIILALYRRHYVEALVYTYTMTFSAMYHLCDGNRTESYKFCVMRLSILSVADFVGSVTSIWVTLVAMVKPPHQVKSVLQVAGVLAFIIGVLYRKTSAWLFIVPAAVGLLLIVAAWVSRCCVRHQCYPSKRRYLLCLLPGLLLAAGGLFIFTYVEKTDNYLYTHSAWHAAMSLCILFLLPPRHTKDKYSVPALGPTYQQISRPEENRVV